jgi:hypothetical protein
MDVIDSELLPLLGDQISSREVSPSGFTVTKTDLD